MQQITGIKVQLQNDANLAGLAEAVIGAGAGLCIDEKIYQGVKGFAQEDRLWKMHTNICLILLRFCMES